MHEAYLYVELTTVALPLPCSERDQQSSVPKVRQAPLEMYK